MAHLRLLSVTKSVYEYECVAAFCNGVFNEDQKDLATVPASCSSFSRPYDRSLWPRNKHKLPVICVLLRNELAKSGSLQICDATSAPSSIAKRSVGPMWPRDIP